MGTIDSRNARLRLPLFMLVGIVLSALSAASEPTSAPAEQGRPSPPIVERGWLEPAAFTRMLELNPATLKAGDRRLPEVRLHPIAMPPTAIARDSTTTFSLELDSIPLIACLQMSVWHQGTDQKPVIRVNGFMAGTLEPAFPSLAERNYVFFFFSNRDGSTDTQLDYQGWLPAKCFFDGHLLKQGENRITLSVETDQIKIRDVAVEALCAPDSDDTVFDFRGPGTR